MLLEYCPATLVSEMNSVAETTRLTELQIMCIFEQIMEGVAYLHTRSPPVFHRDLKIENIFHSYDTKYKIGDFGSATTQYWDPAMLSTSQRTALADALQKKTTGCYRSPEMIDLFRKKVIGTQADIWACGCLLYTMCFYENPFENAGDLAIQNLAYSYPTPEEFTEQELRRISSSPKRLGMENAREPFTTDILSLIDCMLEPDPDARPTAVQVLNKVCQMMGRDLPKELAVWKEEERKRE